MPKFQLETPEGRLVYADWLEEQGQLKKSQAIRKMQACDPGAERALLCAREKLRKWVYAPRGSPFGQVLDEVCLDGVDLNPDQKVAIVMELAKVADPVLAWPLKAPNRRKAVWAHVTFRDMRGVIMEAVGREASVADAPGGTWDSVFAAMHAAEQKAKELIDTWTQLRMYEYKLCDGELIWTHEPKLQIKLEPRLPSSFNFYRGGGR